MRFNYATGGDTGVSLITGVVDVGGLVIGKIESAMNQWFGYAVALGIRDAMIGYGPYDTNTIRYTKGFENGFALQFAIESGAYGDAIDSYVPHMVGGVSYNKDWGNLIGMVGYDSNWDEWTFKGRVNLNVIPDRLKLAFMGTYGTNDDNVRDYFKRTFGHVGLHGGASLRLTERTWFNTQVSWDSADDFAAFANVSFEPVSNLRFIAELNYADMDSGSPGDRYTTKGDVYGVVFRLDRGF